jgi:NAD(P)-dependent dehydrogenase (short-subunit alcohol dehydrogenase family)
MHTRQPNRASSGSVKALASYYAAKDVRVNVIAPGLVETPMSRRAVGDVEILRFMQTKQPLDGGRIGTASDLDAAVVFLLSDGARCCTGQVLALDRGWTVSEGQIVE